MQIRSGDHPMRIRAPISKSSVSMVVPVNSSDSLHPFEIDSQKCSQLWNLMNLQITFKVLIDTVL